MPQEQDLFQLWHGAVKQQAMTSKTMVSPVAPYTNMV